MAVAIGVAAVGAAGAGSALGAPEKAGMALILQRHREALLAEKPADAAQMTRWVDSLGPDGRWPDIDYADREPAGWKAAAHLGRVRALARVVGDPAQPQFKHEKTLAATFRALDHWIEKKYQNPNWWHNQIGTPMQMLDVILLLGDRLAGSRRAGALEIVNQFGRPKPGGAANTVWEARLGMEYGTHRRCGDGGAVCENNR